MSFLSSTISPLVRQFRTVAPALLSGTEDPHAELLTLFWGPQFDRQHALSLWARLSRRQPVEATPLLPQLLAVGDRFDAMDRAEQQQLRHLILRHRALSPALH